MGLFNSPTTLLLIGIICIVLYSLGRYGHIRGRGYFQIIGLAGTSLVILRLFWSMCPARVFGFLLPLLAVAVICPVVIRLYYTMKNTGKPLQRFSFGHRGTRRNNHADHRTGKNPENKSTRPPVSSPAP